MLSDNIFHFQLKSNQLNMDFITSNITATETALSGQTITLANMIDALHDAVVAAYDGTPFQKYKSRWHSAIYKHFASKGIDLVVFSNNFFLGII